MFANGNVITGSLMIILGADILIAAAASADRAGRIGDGVFL